jgi:hypothetical protein
MEPTTAGAGPAGDRPFGPDAAAILATEHWSLLGSRTLIWNEAMSRTSIFLTVLSASIIALTLAASATGFGPRTTTLALVLLPVVLLLGVGTYVRLVQINTEEARTILAMNRLRRAYLTMAPALEPYFSTGHHDDERGLAATYLMAGPRELRPLAHFLVTTPTIIATVDAALATVIVVLVVQAMDASTAAAVVAGMVTFAAAWGALMPMQRNSVTAIRSSAHRFPTPPGER